MLFWVLPDEIRRKRLGDLHALAVAGRQPDHQALALPVTDVLELLGYQSMMTRRNPAATMYQLAIREEAAPGSRGQEICL